MKIYVSDTTCIGIVDIPSKDLDNIVGYLLANNSLLLNINKCKANKLMKLIILTLYELIM